MPTPTGPVNQHEPESYNPPPSGGSGRTLPLVLTTTLVVFFLIGLFSIYFCRYLASTTWLRRSNSSAEVAARPQSLQPTKGLDPLLIASFPTFSYSSVKDLREEKYGLECAVCLAEFADDDELRLLTLCSHVFHTECIDLWLRSHTTCPVCRQELNPQSPDVSIQVEETDARGEADDGLRGEEEEHQQQQQQQGERISFKEDGDRVGNVEDERRSVGELDRLPRSNTTGHSRRWRGDRFTLRLPEDVQERISRERNWTGSCIAFGDFSGSIDDDRKDEMGIGGSRFSDRGPNRV